MKPQKRKPRGYWDDLANVEREILAFIEERGTPGKMPTQRELKNTERGDLSDAISKHGGSQVVGERLGLSCERKQRGYWDDLANIERELLAFIEEYGTPGVMPTGSELKKNNRSDLVNAMFKHGGYTRVAERLGLELAYTAKPSGYWDDFAHLERELLTFIEEYDAPSIMPIASDLNEAKRSDLSHAVLKHGGFQVVAERLGLELAYTRKSQGYWDNFANLERELLAFIQEQNTPGIMPTQKELAKAGRSDLNNGIRQHGGYQSVAKRLRLALDYTKKALDTMGVE